MPLDSFRETLEVNLVGQIAVTQAFMPLIREAKGTIVFIASIGGRIASPFLSPYNASKFGIEALGESLRPELTPWGIDVTVVEPGSIDTADLGEGRRDDRRADRGALARRPPPLRQATRHASARSLTETADRGIHPDKVAKVIHKAIRSDNPRHRYLVGTDAKVAARLKGTLPERTFSKLAPPADEDADRRAGGVAASHPRDLVLLA